VRVCVCVCVCVWVCVCGCRGEGLSGCYSRRLAVHARVDLSTFVNEVKEEAGAERNHRLCVGATLNR
jgi:hypothetical protein